LLVDSVESMMMHGVANPRPPLLLKQDTTRRSWYSFTPRPFYLRGNRSQTSL